MPRSKENQNDLSLGWKKLYRLWDLGLSKKVELSYKIINKSINMSKSPAICWSGGKDSTVVLHLVRKLKPDIPVIYVNSGVDFPETTSFIEELSEKWKINLFIATPKKEYDFWEIGKKYGWPIFGKNIASNVERAVRTKNIRKQLSPLEKLMAKAELKISTKCSQLLQEKPSKEVENILSCDLKFVGLKASESRARVRLWVDHGDLYYVKRYYGRGKGIFKSNPIAIWTDSDIWKYHDKFNLAHCSLYDIGYPRNGCWCCAMAARNGQLKRLREYHPLLFKRLMLKTEMGEVLLKAKDIMLENKKNRPVQSNNIEYILKEYPDYFDYF